MTGPASASDQEKERPQDRAGGAGHGEPAPEPQARDGVGGGRREGEVGHERPRVRVARLDEERRAERGDEAQGRERRPVQGGGRHRQDRHRPEQHEGGPGTDEAVQGMRRVGRGEGGRGAGGGQHARDVGGREAGEGEAELPPAQPLAGPDQPGGEDGACGDPGARPEQALLDGVAHQEQPAERQRHSADPHRPARPEPFLEAGRGGSGSRCRRDRRDGRRAGLWYGRRRALGGHLEVAPRPPRRASRAGATARPRASARADPACAAPRPGRSPLGRAAVPAPPRAPATPRRERGRRSRSRGSRARREREAGSPCPRKAPSRLRAKLSGRRPKG